MKAETEMCKCGVPPPQGARVVIIGDMVYCNAARAARHCAKPHEWHGNEYLHREAVGGDA